MQEYKLTLSTTVDGNSTQISKTGQIEFDEGVLTLVYADEESQTTVKVEKGKAEVIRKGDYAMHLYLEEGKTKTGELQIATGKGEIQVKAHQVKCEVKADKALVTLLYDILFGEEKQEMQIRVLAIKK